MHSGQAYFFTHFGVFVLPNRLVGGIWTYGPKVGLKNSHYHYCKKLYHGCYNTIHFRCSALFVSQISPADKTMKPSPARHFVTNLIASYIPPQLHIVPQSTEVLAYVMNSLYSQINFQTLWQSIHSVKSEKHKMKKEKTLKILMIFRRPMYNWISSRILYCFSVACSTLYCGPICLHIFMQT